MTYDGVRLTPYRPSHRPRAPVEYHVASRVHATTEETTECPGRDVDRPTLGSRGSTKTQGSEGSTNKVGSSGEGLDLSWPRGGSPDSDVGFRPV